MVTESLSITRTVVVNDEEVDVELCVSAKLAPAQRDVGIMQPYVDEYVAFYYDHSLKDGVLVARAIGTTLTEAELERVADKLISQM